MLLVVDPEGNTVTGFPGVLLCVPKCTADYGTYTTEGCLVVHTPKLFVHFTCHPQSCARASIVFHQSRCWARSPPPLSPQSCQRRSTSPHGRTLHFHILHTSTLDVPPIPSLPLKFVWLTLGRALSLAPAALHMKRGSNNNHLRRQPQ
jgi:hypothetical protein